ncbi:hypothetical protein ACGFLS_32400 [Streptomyces abikoensis]
MTNDDRTKTIVAGTAAVLTAYLAHTHPSLIPVITVALAVWGALYLYLRL